MNISSGYAAIMGDLDALIEATLDSELLGSADDQRLADEIADADQRRIDRQRRGEAFIALLLRIASRPRCNVRPTRYATMAA